MFVPAKIRYIDAQLATANLKLGDRLVLTFPTSLNPEAEKRIREHMEEWAPGYPVLILAYGAKLGVVQNAGRDMTNPADAWMSANDVRRVEGL